MVKPIYFLKPAWCGTHFAGLWPEQGLQPVTRATALRRWISLLTARFARKPSARSAEGWRSGVAIKHAVRRFAPGGRFLGVDFDLSKGFGGRALPII